MRSVIMTGIISVGLSTAAAWAGPSRAERDQWRADTRALVPRVKTPPTIDGKINADEWADAVEIDAEISQSSGRVFLQNVVGAGLQGGIDGCQNGRGFAFDVQPGGEDDAPPSAVIAARGGAGGGELQTGQRQPPQGVVVDPADPALAAARGQ